MRKAILLIATAMLFIGDAQLPISKMALEADIPILNYSKIFLKYILMEIAMPAP